MENPRNDFVQASESMAAWMGPEESTRDRVDFVSNLGVLLSQTREGIKGCWLEVGEDYEFVHVVFNSGYEQIVNVRCDSYMAIVKDVVKNIEL